MIAAALLGAGLLALVYYGTEELTRAFYERAARRRVIARLELMADVKRALWEYEDYCAGAVASDECV